MGRLRALELPFVERPPHPQSATIPAHVAEYADRTTLRCGLAVIKRRLLKALEASALRFHEIDGAQVVYPRDGPVAGYFFAHPDPVALICWFADEVGPAVRRALLKHHRLAS